MQYCNDAYCTEDHLKWEVRHNKKFTFTKFTPTNYEKYLSADLSRKNGNAENIHCSCCCGGKGSPRHGHGHGHQVGGESVLMVVGGDNLADNQESSMEIYNRLKFIICIAEDGGDVNDVIAMMRKMMTTFNISLV